MLYASSSSSSCQQYLVYSSSDILKSMQQLNRLDKVQITQDKTMESLHFSGRYWCCNFWTWDYFAQLLKQQFFWSISFGTEGLSRVQLLAQSREFSLFQKVQTDSEAHLFTAYQGSFYLSVLFTSYWGDHMSCTGHVAYTGIRNACSRLLGSCSWRREGNTRQMQMTKVVRVHSQIEMWAPQAG